MQTWQRRTLKYTLLPGFLPRLQELFASGFHHIAYLMALIYQAVRLLPRDHPYLHPANQGKFGIRHVIAEAASNLVLKKENADQIIVFTILLAGIVVLFLQAILLIFAVIAQHPAIAAAPDTLTDLLGISPKYNRGPEQDIAFMTLDRVFGLINVYNSCIVTSADCLDMRGNPIPTAMGSYPTTFNTALNSLLKFYALGLFFVAIFIIIYFVITLVAESAMSGSPFGQRFNEAWVPIRLILFFALLVPLNGTYNQGLNTAQMIVFWTAKYGSNLATNAWGKYNYVLTAHNYHGLKQKLKVTPTIPQVNDLIRFMHVAKTCKIAEETLYPGSDVQAYIIRQDTVNLIASAENYISFDQTNYLQALKFANYGSIIIRFGKLEKSQQHGSSTGSTYVNPVCGEIVFENTTVQKSDPSHVQKTGQNAQGTDAAAIQDIYYIMLRDMWRYGPFVTYGTCLYKSMAEENPEPNCTPKMDATFANESIKKFQDYLKNKIPAAIKENVEDGNFGTPEVLMRKGWAGAGIWYNRIAEMNGDISSATMNMPKPAKYPYVFESVAIRNKEGNEDISLGNLFDPKLADETKVQFDRPKDRKIHEILYRAYKFWDEGNDYKPAQVTRKNNTFEAAVTAIFGIEGIYRMRDNTDVHPLAQLSALGKGMMDATLRNIAIGKVGGLASSGLLKLIPNNAIGKLGQTASTFIEAVGWSTMSMAFIMYYILPFMPFVYFFFAMGGWMKALFEAVVAVPLWALAHIRIDGPGMPGPGATNGYFLLLELFLRPLLTIFGLIASISIFAAVVNVLNDIFALSVENLTGFDYRQGQDPSKLEVGFYRGAIDQFFFTVIYVVLCYMMGLGCFKLIDAIPNNIMRWFGVSVQTFDEKGQDFAGELTSKTYTGTMLLGGKLQGGQVAALLNG